MYRARDTRGREQVSVYQRGPRAAAREPHRAKAGECEVTASLSHVRARQALGRGSAMRRPSLFAPTLLAKDGRREASHVADRSARGEGVATTTLVLIDGRQEHFDPEQVQLQPYGVEVRELLPEAAPSGHFTASDPRGAARVRVRRDTRELKRRRRQNIPAGAFRPPGNRALAPYELDLRGCSDPCGESGPWPGEGLSATPATVRRETGRWAW